MCGDEVLKYDVFSKANMKIRKSLECGVHGRG